jgi:hypothetical protein
VRRRSWLRRLAPVVVAPVLLTGCIDEISEIFTIILFSESDDPDETQCSQRQPSAASMRLESIAATKAA